MASDRIQNIIRAAKLWGMIFFILSGLCTITGFFGLVGLPFELTSHFRFQYLIIAGIGSVIFFLKRQWILLGIGIVTVLINMVVIIPWYYNDQKPVQDYSIPSIRVLFSNVNAGNSKNNALIDLIRQEDPDIAIFAEINDNWMTAIEILKQEYVYSIVERGLGNNGIAIVSRVPFEEHRNITFDIDWVPSIEMVLSIGDHVISLLATHPYSPTSFRKFKLRNTQLKGLHAYIMKQKTETVVIGDLNVTMWSPYYHSLLDSTNLLNARDGFGIIPTWPTFLPLLHIPIDHCLHSPEIKVVDFRSASTIGSDHLPIIVDLMFPAFQSNL